MHYKTIISALALVSLGAEAATIPHRGIQTREAQDETLTRIEEFRAQNKDSLDAQQLQFLDNIRGAAAEGPLPISLDVFFNLLGNLPLLGGLLSGVTNTAANLPVVGNVLTNLGAREAAAEQQDAVAQIDQFRAENEDALSEEQVQYLDQMKGLASAGSLPLPIGPLLGLLGNLPFLGAILSQFAGGALGGLIGGGSGNTTGGLPGGLGGLTGGLGGLTGGLGGLTGGLGGLTGGLGGLTGGLSGLTGGLSGLTGGLGGLTGGLGGLTGGQ